MQEYVFQAGHYSAQSGKSSNLCFLTGYRTLTGQRTFFISRNSSRSRDSLRHYLWSVKIEGWQFSKLIKPIDRLFKCDHFLQKNLTQIVNRSQDNRAQIFRKSGGNDVRLFYQTLFDLLTCDTCIFLFSFTEFIKSNILISDSILIKI